MANKDYNDISQLLLDLEKDVQKKVAKSVVEKIKDIEQDVIQEVVYNQYNPEFYIRRGVDGGLMDRDNMEEDIKNSKGGIEISVTNKTKGNDHYGYAQGYTDGYIADIIETGNGYGYGLNIGKRPFQETTQNIIDLTDEIDKVIEDNLSDWLDS